MWTLLVTICIIYNYYIVDRLSNLTSAGNVLSMISIDRELWVTLLTFAMFVICVKLCETFLHDVLQMQPELLHIHNFAMPIVPMLEQFPPVQHQHFQQVAIDEIGGGDAQALIQDSESESDNDDDVDEYFLEY